MSTIDTSNIFTLAQSQSLRISTLYGMYLSQENNHVTRCKDDKNEMEHEEATRIYRVSFVLGWEDQPEGFDGFF